jgi:hypothetical protein
MTSYWSRVEPFWNDCPTDDPAAYLAFYKSMPAVARDLLTTHWVSPDDWNPFDRLDDQFYSALDLGGEEDAYTRKADAYAG